MWLLLGHSLAAIAEQKAGIIKPNAPLVTGRIEPEALAVIEDSSKQAPLIMFMGSLIKFRAWAGLTQESILAFSNAHREAEPT